MSDSKAVMDMKAAMAKSVGAVKNRASAPGQSLSHKGGRLMYGDVRLPDDQITCIVMDYGTQNTYYDSPFDSSAETYAPPRCFSVTHDDPGHMIPHTNVLEPINDSCRSCEMAEFKHGPNKNAPACKARRKLVILPDITEADRVGNADTAIFQTTPTSSKVWDKYVLGLSSKGLPWWAVRTRIAVVPPKKKGMYDIEFHFEGIIEDEALLAAIHSRIEEAEVEVMKPYTYDVPTEEESDSDNF